MGTLLCFRKTLASTNFMGKMGDVGNITVFCQRFVVSEYGKNCSSKLLRFSKICVSKNVRDERRRVFRFSVGIFLSHSTEKILRDLFSASLNLDIEKGKG